VSDCHVATRIVALVTAVLTGVGMAACGGGSDTSNEPKQNDKAQLEIWVRKPPGSAAEKTAKELAAAFTKASGIPTNVTALFDDFETKLQQVAAQKQLPDIVINDTAQLGTMVKQGIVRTVNKKDIAGQDSLTQTSWDAAKGADGKYHAVPFSTQSFALFIRKDWREKLGLGVPTSWSEMDALATAFTTRDPDGNGKADTYGYVVPGSTKRGYTSWYFTSFLWAGGGDFFTEKKGKFTPAISSPQSVAAVDWFKAQFCTSKTVAPGAVQMETVQAHPVFETGKGGIYFTGPYNMARFDKNLGKDKYEVVDPPAGPKGDTVLAEGTTVYFMAGSKKADQAKQLAEFFLTPEIQKTGMTQPGGGSIVRLPVNKNVDITAVMNDQRWTDNLRLYNEKGKYLPNVPGWGTLRQDSAETVNKVISSCGSDAQKELDTLNTKFGETLKKYDALAG
jgi:multiple sugar transport system substrate-binding protein